MKIAITGSSGHIGNNLARELINRGHQIKVLINKSKQALDGMQVERIHGNILDTEAVEGLINGCEYVFHAAAIISIGNKPPQKVYNVNTEGTKNVVNACLKFGVKRLVHFSSIHSFHCKNPNAVLNEDNPPAGVKDLTYNKSKAMGESIVSEAYKKGLNAVILNPSSVVGPNDFMPSLIGQMILKIAKGRLPFLIIGGYHFVDVRDVVDAAINAMHSGRAGEKYLLTSEWKSLTEVAGIICKKARKRAPIVLPTFMAWLGLPFIQIFSRLMNQKPLYTRESIKIIKKAPRRVENCKAIRELDFRTRPVQETFSDVYDWFVAQNYLPKPRNYDRY